MFEIITCTLLMYINFYEHSNEGPRAYHPPEILPHSARAIETAFLTTAALCPHPPGRPTTPCRTRRVPAMWGLNAGYVSRTDPPVAPALQGTGRSPAGCCCDRGGRGSSESRPALRCFLRSCALAATPACRLKPATLPTGSPN